MSQPKCKHDIGQYCIREECVGPCTLVEEIWIDDEEMEDILAWVDHQEKSLN